MVIKITGCGDCPLFYQDPDEGCVCCHPEGENVKAGGSGMLIETPDNCPLIKEALNISYDNR